MNNMQNRLQAIQQRIQTIESNPLNMGSDAANAELEQLRGQLDQAVQEQEALNRAVENMDVEAANQAYLRLSQTVGNTERYIRDNVDEQGRFNREIEEGTNEANSLMQNAVQIAAQNLEASPEMRGLLEAIAEKYGTDATDLTALTDAIRNGVVKDDAYFEKIAMEKGISVKTAREMDKLETQNKRLTAQQQAAQQMQKAAAERARIAQIQARWDAEAEALQAKYPDFDREEVLANPEVEKMMRAGCSMEAAYRAAYFDRLMARQTAATAQQTEQGVLNRVQQRASRPAENGTRPGGAVQTHLDVEHMSRKDREALEKRVLRGEIITL